MDAIIKLDEIVEADFVITPEMINIVTDRIELLLVLAKGRGEKLVSISPREMREFFDAPRGMMTQILNDIYANPPARIRAAAGKITRR